MWHHSNTKLSVPVSSEGNLTNLIWKCYSSKRKMSCHLHHFTHSSALPSRLSLRRISLRKMQKYSNTSFISDLSALILPFLSPTLYDNVMTVQESCARVIEPGWFLNPSKCHNGLSSVTQRAVHHKGGFKQAFLKAKRWHAGASVIDKRTSLLMKPPVMISIFEPRV